VLTVWIGNTPKIAARRYLQVTDADFAKAVQNQVQPTCAEPRQECQETTQPI